jgi:hypothetical protein
MGVPVRNHCVAADEQQRPFARARCEGDLRTRTATPATPFHSGTYFTVLWIPRGGGVVFGGSVWESNLLGADSPSTYEEGLGLNWKDLPSFGILNAAFLPPRFFIPLFSSEEPFQRLDCWPPASHRAPLACKCSLLCECPNAAEVLAEPSSPLATNEAVWSTNA